MSDRGQSVCYGMSPYDSNSMKSDNPNSGIYEAETSRTLDPNGNNPNCNQGGMLVINSHDITINEDRTNALLHGKNDSHDIPCVLGLDRASFNQGKNAKYDISIQEEIAQPLVARGPGGGNDTIGALCARDYKGVGNQFVDEGKVIIQSYK